VLGYLGASSAETGAGQRPDRSITGGHHEQGHCRAEGSASVVSQLAARAIPLAAAALALLLSACAGSSSRQAATACPTVLLLKGAERTAAYRPGPNPRPADLEYLAVMTNLATDCAYTEDGADVALRFDLIGEKGPAYGGGPVSLTYFVATIRPNEQVWNKQLLKTEVVFSEGAERGGHAEEMTVQLPKVQAAEGASYQVYLGFQLDDAEMRRRLGSEAR
jgi:hypothetical protein